jgi:perosamine synthetase
MRALARPTRLRSRRLTYAAGSNSLGEAAIALAALVGRVPLGYGPDITRYEQQFAATCGVRQAFSFASGRMALYALLEAYGIGPGDEVITPAFTCVVVANAILYRGAHPVYVDIQPRTYNLDPGKLDASITPRTRAIIAQHTFGLVCDVDAISQMAKERNILVLEDAAHALGASYDHQSVGALGNAAYFSTDHTKITGTGTGGMITTNDEELIAKLYANHQIMHYLSFAHIRLLLVAFVAEALLFHPRLFVVGRKLYATLWRLGCSRAFFMDELSLAKPSAYPYPALLGNAQALIGLSQLANLSSNIAHRRQLAAAYEAYVKAYSGLLEPGFTNHAFLRYTFLVRNRKAWIDYLSDVLEPDIWFTSVTHGRADNLHLVGYQPGSCPMAEQAASDCINLPTHPRVAASDLVPLVKQARASGCPGLALC